MICHYAVLFCTAHKHSTCHPERSRTRTGLRLKPRTVRATACGRDLETSFRVFRNSKLLFITNITIHRLSREIRMLRIRPYAMLRGFDCACAPLKMTPRGWSFCYPRTQVRGFRRRRKLTPRGCCREGKQSNTARKHSTCHPERSRSFA